MNTSLNEIAEEIKERSNFIILGHIDADGDCIGSMFALKWILDQLHKKSVILVNESPLEEFDFYFVSESPGDYQLISEFDEENSDWHDYNIIALDAGDVSRLGNATRLIKDRVFLNIDHHPDNPGYGYFNYINPKKAATGEIIFDLASSLGIAINKKIGTAIATAIISDTGALRYENTSPRVLYLLAALMEIGVNIYAINKLLFGNFSFASLKLKGMALATLQRCADGKIAWLYVDDAMLKKAETDEKSTTGLVNYARDIRGVEVGISFVKIGNTETKVSFRSNYRVAVNEIADKFGGGGHPKAAGCVLNTDLEESIRLVLNEVKKFV